MVTRAKNKKPIIGINCDVMKLKPYYSEFELVCDYRYIRAIVRAGGLPILIPIHHNRTDVKRIVGMVDGLMLIGGEDIPPSFYGEKPFHRIKPMYRGRARFDISLFQFAHEKQIPILGICYGMQLVNVVFGGSLYQDIQRQVKGTKSHRSRRDPHHAVHLNEDSKLAKIFGKADITVHSDHHQAIKTVGNTISPVAYSDDSVIEAIEGPKKVLAVQWHPERQERDMIQRKLFQYFIKKCREKKWA